MEDARRGQELTAKLVYHVVENKKCVVHVSPSSLTFMQNKEKPFYMLRKFKFICDIMVAHSMPMKK